MDIKQEIEHIAERLKKDDGLLDSFKMCIRDSSSIRLPTYSVGV